MQDLTPELSRAAERPTARCTSLPHRAEAAKRTRLERIVRRLTSELFLAGRSNPRTDGRPGQVAQNWFCTPASFSRGCATTDGVQLLSSCTEYVADGHCESQRPSVGDPHVEKILVWRRLTPELGRTDLRRRQSHNLSGTLSTPRSGVGTSELLAG